MTSDAYRITQAIRYLDAHADEQPDLPSLAEAAGVSPGHFQRIFKRWAGVSPKRFLQYATAAHARTLLDEGSSVLEAALGVGLSGPGRLHDLHVAVHAMTPGEVARGGADVVVRYGHIESPFGPALLAATDRGICHLAFHDPDERQAAVTELRAAWPAATHIEDLGHARALAARAFGGPADRPALALKGTNFQLQVWNALLHLPPGHVIRYGDLARLLGRPGAARAVGTAVATNAIAWLIPCHRVIRATGAYDAYRWGRARKRLLLGHEAARRATGAPL